MQPCDPEVTATAEPPDPSPTPFSTSPAPCSKAAPHSNQPSPSKMTLDNGWGVLPRMTGEAGKSSSRALGLDRGLDEQSVEGVGAFGGAQLLDQAGVAQQSRHARQGFQMVRTGAFGRRQQEHDVDRAIVDGVEIDRLGESREQSDRLGERRQARVRDGDAAADARRAQTLALEQAVEQAALLRLEKSGAPACPVRPQSLLPRRPSGPPNGLRA